MKQIQVFLHGDQGPEIHGYLVSHKFKDGMHQVRFKEDFNDKEVWESWVPLSSIKMIRLYKERDLK